MSVRQTYACLVNEATKDVVIGAATVLLGVSVLAITAQNVVASQESGPPPRLAVSAEKVLGNVGSSYLVTANVAVTNPTGHAWERLTLTVTTSDGQLVVNPGQVTPPGGLGPHAREVVPIVYQVPVGQAADTVSVRVQAYTANAFAPDWSPWGTANLSSVGQLGG